jgi:transcription-repair coupling factor (superfamily II helicase)
VILKVSFLSYPGGETVAIFNEIIKFNKDNHDISGLTSELKGIYVNDAYKCSNKNILVVSNSLYEASKFYQTLSNHNESVLFFPMDDFLTSEALAISPELKTTRLETLNTILNNETNIIVTNLMGYLRFLPSLNTYKKSKIHLRVNNDIKINELVENLDKIAEQTGRTRNEIIQTCIEFAVENLEIKENK